MATLHATPPHVTNMTDLTPTLNTLLAAKNGSPIPAPATRTSPTEVAGEFLKEAHRINSHITSLLKYLHSIRHAYLTTSANPRRHAKDTHHAISIPQSQTDHLTDPERDEIDTSTALLLRDLATSIANLSSAESLRQETSASLLRKKYGHSAAGALLWRWAGGGSALDESTAQEGKSTEQIEAEEKAKTIAGVREGVLWFLRRGLDGVAGVQRGMVEKRIERVREKEKSVLYKRAGTAAAGGAGMTKGGEGGGPGARTVDISTSSGPAPDATVLSEAETARIEAQLSPEQLQLFAEENDTMLRHYEDTLGKVQNAEKSLLEISSLQETLVSHLATQEEYISQLVSDVDTTQSNVGRGNKELKRATERRSTAQAVFWGTVGLCTWLVVWDLVF
ncbi:Syntaxin UFE1 [Penicillium rolfsii]|nr:Syntaxin UFE1 [Penicillium rolfsii]